MSIFQTKAWQRTWWEIWGSTRGFRFFKGAPYPAVGLYIHSYRLLGILPIRCLQFVGTNYRCISTPRSEYNTLIQRRKHDANPGLGAIENLVLGRWSEAVFRDVPSASPDIVELRRMADQNGWLWRIVGEDVAYSIDTKGDWDGYLSMLGKNSRLRLFNRRKLLEDHGRIELINAWPAQVDHFFELLNGFHIKRWGRRCFNEQSLAFHLAFLESVVDENGEPELSILYCNGQPISVLYNVLYDGCVYNIQAGFEECFHRKLAVGTLHLGYSIQDSFERSGVNKFDFLAGSGKNENYKARLATDSEKLVSVMLVRNRLLQLLYRFKR